MAAYLHFSFYVAVAAVYAAKALELRDIKLARKVFMGLPIALPVMTSLSARVNVFDLLLSAAHGGLALT